MPNHDPASLAESPKRLIASAIAKSRDYYAARYRMEFARRHIPLVDDILPQRRFVPGCHTIREVLIAARVKQQVGILRHTHVSDRKEHRAGRLAMTVDAKALSRCIVFPDHRLEFRKSLGAARTHPHAKRSN